ncbi:MAG: hypothetical protein LBK29_01160 [Oscillospiraceae bacterium]|jgi:hypothetical protein|nr:hypothetical protein [Oscillospiraceae bacterium]
MKEIIERVMDKITGDEEKLAYFIGLKDSDEIYRYCLSIKGGYSKQEFDDYMEKILSKAERIENSKFGSKRGKVFSKILAAGLAALSIAPVLSNNLSVFGENGSDDRTGSTHQEDSSQESLFDRVLPDNKHQLVKSIASAGVGAALGAFFTGVAWYFVGGKSTDLTGTVFGVSLLGVSTLINITKTLIDRVPAGKCLVTEDLGDHFPQLAGETKRLSDSLNLKKENQALRSNLVSDLKFVANLGMPRNIKKCDGTATQASRDLVAAVDEYVSFLGQTINTRAGALRWNSNDLDQTKTEELIAILGRISSASEKITRCDEEGAEFKQPAAEEEGEVQAND